jgi:hypothetical protein
LSSPSKSYFGDEPSVFSREVNELSPRIFKGA